jgi:hypothetical protein
MRRLIPFLALAAVLFGAAPAHADHQVPFRATDTGTFSFVPTSVPAVVETTDVGTGHATHLGKYTFRATERINLLTLAVTDGRYTLTAANGDTLEGTYSGQAQTTSTAGVITYLVSGPITGGTGRFVGATGYVTWNGGGDLTVGTLYDTITGYISAPGN